MHIYIEFLLHIPNHNLNHFFYIEFLSFCLHIKGLHDDICTAIFPQSSARAVLGCARLCSQASINPSSCFPAAKIPHILLYKEAFCLPFVSSDHPIIPSLTGHWSTTHSPFSILNILSWSTLINPYTLYILSYLTAIHINISASSLIKGPWFNSTWAQLPQQWPCPTRLFCHILHPVFLIFYNPTQRTWVQFLFKASSPYSL